MGLGGSTGKKAQKKTKNEPMKTTQPFSSEAPLTSLEISEEPLTSLEISEEILRAFHNLCGNPSIPTNKFMHS